MTLVPFLTEAITFGPPFGTKSFEELIDAIINFIFWVAMALVPIMIIIAAFYFLTSGGDPEKVKTAKKIILYTIIGLIIVFLGKGIVAIIGQIFEGAPPPPPPPGVCDVGSCMPAVTCNSAGGICDYSDPDCNFSGLCCCILTCADVGGSCMRPATCFTIPPAGSYTCYLKPFECTAPDGCCCVP